MLRDLVSHPAKILFCCLIILSADIHAEYGDIILNKTADAMREAEVDDVIFPHWFHRIRFRCSVCHESIFKIEAGANDISMSAITEEKKQCGVCHDGLVAWEPLECERCHSLEEGWSPGAIQHSVREDEKQDILLGKTGSTAKPYSKFMEIGTGWHPLALSKSGLPLDRYGLVDWADAVRKKIVQPLWSLDPKVDISEHKLRDTEILFISKGESMPDVIFPHDIHSYWLECDICHDTQGGPMFVDELGANNITMVGIGQGKWCARCHDKVGFPISDCTRCHNHPKGAPTGKNVLLRPLKAPLPPPPAAPIEKPEEQEDVDSDFF